MFIPRFKEWDNFCYFNVFFWNTPVMKDKLQIYVIGFAMQLITFLPKSIPMSSQSVDVLHPQVITVRITSSSQTGVRNVF